MDRILITTASFGVDDSSALACLRDEGYDVVLNPHGRKLTEEEVRGLLLEVGPVGIVAGLEPLTAKVLQGAGRLRVISRCGVGMDNVDLGTARRGGITVLCTPDGPVQAVAELTVGLMLAGLRHIARVDRSIRAGKWERPMGRLLGEQTVGVVGCGRIGSAVARLLASFGSRLIGSDPSLQEHPDITLTPLDGLLRESDVVTLHVPYDENTHHMINDQSIGKMKPTALLVNTARAGIIDEQALLETIQSGRLAGACIDTFSEEPYSGPLAGLPQVVLTSHIGSYAREARVKMESQAVQNLLAALKE